CVWFGRRRGDGIGGCGADRAAGRARRLWRGASCAQDTAGQGDGTAERNRRAVQYRGWRAQACGDRRGCRRSRRRGDRSGRLIVGRRLTWEGGGATSRQRLFREDIMAIVNSLLLAAHLAGLAMIVGATLVLWRAGGVLARGEASPGMTRLGKRVIALGDIGLGLNWISGPVMIFTKYGGFGAFVGLGPWF